MKVYPFSGDIKYPNIQWFKFGFILNEGGTKVIDFNTKGCWFRVALYFSHWSIQFGITKYRPPLICEYRRYKWYR